MGTFVSASSPANSAFAWGRSRLILFPTAIALQLSATPARRHVAAGARSFVGVFGRKEGDKWGEGCVVMW
jgi:hypothetical protein